MPRPPKITVQSWGADGPAYTVHHRIAGWRNRAARRAGSGAELVGDHAAAHVDAPAAFLAIARGDDELWLFNRGHVYELEVLIDGDETRILVDARDDFYQHRFGAEIQLFGHCALDAGELAGYGISSLEGLQDTQDVELAGIPIWKAPISLEDLLAMPADEDSSTITVSQAFGEEYAIEPGEWVSDELFAELRSVGAITESDDEDLADEEE